MKEPPVELTGLSGKTLRTKVLKCVDLFCGAGGTSTAMIEVAKAFDLYCQLTGVNHWPTAIETHRRNHPDANLLCEDLHGSNPYRIFKEFELDALWASPSCTKTAILRQIGNAVPRRLARAIVAAALTQNPDAPEAICL